MLNMPSRTNSMIATNENCIIGIPDTAFNAPPSFSFSK